MSEYPYNTAPSGQQSLSLLSFSSGDADARLRMQQAFKEHPSAYLSAAQNQLPLLNSLSDYVSSFINDEDRSYRASILSSEVKKALIQIDQLPLPTGQNERCHEIAEELLEALDEITRCDYEIDCNMAMHLCNLVIATKAAFSTCDSFEVTKYAINGVDQSGTPLEFSMETLLTLTNAKGVVFDVDDCLILSEVYQQIVWNRVLDEVAAEFGPERERVAKELKDVFDAVCKTSDWEQLMPRLGNTLLKYGIFPRGVTSYKELDAFFRDKRAPQLKHSCEVGEIILTPGTVDFLTALKERGIEIGIFTSSSKILADSMLETLLEEQGIDYDELIPESQRVYGPSISRPKPDPQGWYIATEQLGLEPENVIIFDDRMKILAHAAAATPHFGATIGIYHDDSSTNKWRQSTANRSFASGVSGGEIVRFNPETIFGFIKNFSYLRVK